MASGFDVKTTSIIPLNGKNVPTWKVQCRMALMRDMSPDPDKAKDLAKLTLNDVFPQKVCKEW